MSSVRDQDLMVEAQMQRELQSAYVPACLCVHYSMYDSERRGAGCNTEAVSQEIKSHLTGPLNHNAHTIKV